jgi:tRNA A37 threonylcarbamoyladenosine biosynthesis protein TsaE
MTDHPTDTAPTIYTATTPAERGAAVNRAEQVVLTAAVALVEWYDEVHADTQKQRLRAAVTALKAAEMAS